MTIATNLSHAASTDDRKLRDPVEARIRNGFVYVPDDAKVVDALEVVRLTRVPTGQAAVVFILDAQGRCKLSGFPYFCGLTRNALSQRFSTGRT